MKKVLIVSGSLPQIRCGVGYYTRRLIGELSAENLDFEALSTTGVDEDLPKKLWLVRNWRLASSGKIYRAVKRSGAGIVHIQYPAVGYKRQLGINLLPYLLRLKGKRVFVTLHEYHESRLVGRVRDFLTVLPSNKIILSNEQDRFALPGFLRRKSLIIPIGPNINKVQANPAVYKNLLKKHGLNASAPTLLYFGFAFAAKNIESLLAAMMEDDLKNHQLILMCELDPADDYQTKLIRQIDSINADGARVIVTGFLSDQQISQILQAGKYFLLPQHQPLSAKSSTAITAVTHGLILISTGARDSAQTKPFIDGVNCRLLTNTSPSSIAKVVSELEESKELRNTIEKGLTELAQYFSWQNIVNKHMDLYEKD